MSIDILQEKIRKLKCPILVDFSVLPEHIPTHLRGGTDELGAYVRFCRELIAGLEGVVPGIRFSFDCFALMGDGGLTALSRLLKEAREKGFYVLLDSSQILTPWAAQRAAKSFLTEDALWPCDGLVISPYIGSDAIRPFLEACREGKSLFVALRTPNKSAPELQELITGSRHVYSAVADMIGRFGTNSKGKYGYPNVCAVASAGAPSSLSELRSKYKELFLLVDGCDYPGSSVKSCALAFDRVGHGSAVCAGISITAAWYAAETDGTDLVEQAVQAVRRLKKNLGRYLAVM